MGLVYSLGMAVFNPDDIVLAEKSPWAERNPDEIPLAHLTRQELFSLVCRIGQIVFPHNDTLKGELPDVTANQLLQQIKFQEEALAGDYDGE